MTWLTVTFVGVPVIHGDEVYVTEHKAVIVILFQGFCESYIQQLSSVKFLFSILISKQIKQLRDSDLTADIYSFLPVTGLEPKYSISAALMGLSPWNAAYGTTTMCPPWNVTYGMSTVCSLWNAAHGMKASKQTMGAVKMAEERLNLAQLSSPVRRLQEDRFDAPSQPRAQAFQE